MFTGFEGKADREKLFELARTNRVLLFLEEESFAATLRSPDPVLPMYMKATALMQPMVSE